LLCAYGWDTLWEWKGPSRERAGRLSWLASPRTLASVLLAAAVVAALWAASPLLMSDTERAGEMILTERAGVRTRGAANLAELIRTVQRHAPVDRSILCLPYQPIFY